MTALPVQLEPLYVVTVAAVDEHEIEMDVPRPIAVHEVRGSVLYCATKFGPVALFTVHVGLVS